MSRGFLLFTDGKMRLCVFRNEKVLFVASVINEEFCELQITEIVCCTIHTDERKLDLLMSGGCKLCRFFSHEGFFDAICVFFHQLQESVFSCGFIISDCRLHQMSRTVKLVPVSVGIALLGRTGDEIRIEITVLTLIFLNLVDDPFNFFFQIGIFFLVKNVCRTFHPFGNVGVPEDVRLVRLSLLPIATESGNSARVVEAIVNGIDCDVFVQHLFIV